MQPRLPPWHLVSTFQNKRILTENYLFVSRRYWTLWVVTVNQTNRSSAPSLPLDHFPASSDNQKRVQDSPLSLCFPQLHLQNPAKKRQGENSHLPQPPGRQEQGVWWQKGFAFQMLQVWQAAGRSHHSAAITLLQEGPGLLHGFSACHRWHLGDAVQFLLLAEPLRCDTVPLQASWQPLLLELQVARQRSPNFHFCLWGTGFRCM